MGWDVALSVQKAPEQDVITGACEEHDVGESLESERSQLRIRFVGVMARAEAGVTDESIDQCLDCIDESQCCVDSSLGEVIGGGVFEVELELVMPNRVPHAPVA